MGLSIEEMKLIINPDLTWFQMHQIRRGFEHGFTMEQVLTYAKPEFE